MINYEAKYEDWWYENMKNMKKDEYEWNECRNENEFQRIWIWKRYENDD
jgi:hypothetical protein